MMERKFLPCLFVPIPNSSWMSTVTIWLCMYSYLSLSQILKTSLVPRSSVQSLEACNRYWFERTQSAIRCMILERIIHIHCQCTEGYSEEFSPLQWLSPPTYLMWSYQLRPLSGLYLIYDASPNDVCYNNPQLVSLYSRYPLAITCTVPGNTTSSVYESARSSQLSV